jgi:hypothetical protein
VGSPLRLSCWFPSQVPSPERRQPYSGPSRFVNRAAYPLVVPGIPTVSLVCPVRPAAQGAESCGSYGWNVGCSLGIPQGSTAEAPQAVVPTQWPNTRVLLPRGPWRHLATSTTDRNAVLCPWAQDGHRKPLNFRPVGSR